MTPKTSRTVQIGTHRGNRRLWLEGQWLKAAGFMPGARITVTYKGKGVAIALDANGARRVSGKRAGTVSVIDINCAALTETLPSGPASVEIRDSILGPMLLVMADHDPHCTCNDCIDDFIVQTERALENGVQICLHCGAQEDVQ